MSRLDESETDWEQFELFIDTLPALYPLVHEHLERELVGGYSTLYRWPGVSDSNPSVLMAHYDVVPATDEGWKHPPFSGVEVEDADGHPVIWGRGTLDDKGSLVVTLEAVEALLAHGFTPASDIYLSFGHNEETAGDGAEAVVSLLESRGIVPAFVLDEGGAVVEGIFPGVDDPIAVIGVAEKGIMTLTMTVDQEGGHAPSPDCHRATGEGGRGAELPPVQGRVHQDQP